jgi:YHS domain-containing protein
MNDEASTIATDPVCGMEVDTKTSQLSLDHDGRTYWFCGKGCLLEFRDDPERFLDPGHVPSM